MVLAFDGRALKRARAARGFTQRMLAREIRKVIGHRCSEDSVTSYEIGRREPDFARGLALASILHLEPWDLVTEKAARRKVVEDE